MCQYTDILYSMDKRTQGRYEIVRQSEMMLAGSPWMLYSFHGFVLYIHVPIFFPSDETIETLYEKTFIFFLPYAKNKDTNPVHSDQCICCSSWYLYHVIKFRRQVLS